MAMRLRAIGVTVISLVIVVVAGALAFAAGSAQVTHAGAAGNGSIAFVRHDGIYVMRADGTGMRPLRLGPVASRAFELDWSPDGRRLAFESGGAIWVMRADGKGLARLVAPRDVDGWPGEVHSPSWSPDGRRIAFSIGIRCCSKPRYEQVKGIWVVNADGSNLRRLLGLQGLGSGRGVGEIDWSPDGRRFAFTSHSGWVAWVYVVNTNGTDLRRLTGNPRGFPWASDPDWSPDGRRIAFEQTFPSKNVGPFSEEIYVMTVDSGSQLRLTSNGVPDTSPTWSSDGRIAFVRFESCPSCPLRPAREGDAREIFVMNADGTGVTQLTDDRAGSARPAWRQVAAR